MAHIWHVSRVALGPLARQKVRQYVHPNGTQAQISENLPDLAKFRLLRPHFGVDGGVPLGCTYLKFFVGRLSIDNSARENRNGCWYNPLKKSLPKLSKISLFLAFSLTPKEFRHN